MANEALPQTLDVAAIRQDFPILQQTVYDGRRLAYLDNAASTQRPLSVLRVIDDLYRNSYANVHRGIHWLSEQSTELYESARDRMRRFINAAHSDEVIFTSGTTAGINLVARSWGDAVVREGDEILLTIAEHHSNIVPWQQLAQRSGCRILFAPLRHDHSLDVESLCSMLSDRTRMVAIASASNVLGAVNPLEPVISAARQAGALVLVDAAQTAPHEPLDVQALGADFVVFSGHKMLGPNAIGILYGRQDLLNDVPPFLGGGSMIRTVTTTGFTPARLPEKFEAGTPPIAEACGLAAAADYLEKLGLERIARHQTALVQALRGELKEITGVRLLGPDSGPHCGLVSFVIDGIHPHDAAHLLDRCGVAVRAGHHCAMPLHAQLGLSASTRASFYVYNDFDDVEQLVRSLHLVKKTLAS